jgi:hypothetical protein
MEPMTDRANRTFRYGDFPELFWDAQPDVAIDVQNPVTLARLLTRGRPEIIGQLVPLELIQERLDTLAVPEHVRVFWRFVLRTRRSVAPGAAVPREGDG